MPLLFKMDTSNYNATLLTYLSMRDIAWNVIGWGGIGSLFSGLTLAIFTSWGLLNIGG
jgi:hypothetical protein